MLHALHTLINNMALTHLYQIQYCKAPPCHTHSRSPPPPLHTYTHTHTHAHSLAFICDTHQSPTFFLSNTPDSKGDQLRHVNQLMETAQKQLNKSTNSAPKLRVPIATTTPPLYIGGGLPPISGKLVPAVFRMAIS